MWLFTMLLLQKYDSNKEVSIADKRLSLYLLTKLNSVYN